MTNNYPPMNHQSTTNQLYSSGIHSPSTGPAVLTNPPFTNPAFTKHSPQRSPSAGPPAADRRSVVHLPRGPRQRRAASARAAPRGAARLSETLWGGSWWALVGHQVGSVGSSKGLVVGWVGWMDGWLDEVGWMVG